MSFLDRLPQKMLKGTSDSDNYQGTAIGVRLQKELNFLFIFITGCSWKGLNFLLFSSWTDKTWWFKKTNAHFFSVLLVYHKGASKAIHNYQVPISHGNVIQFNSLNYSVIQRCQKKLWLFFLSLMWSYGIFSSVLFWLSALLLCKWDFSCVSIQCK